MDIVIIGTPTKKKCPHCGSDQVFGYSRRTYDPDDGMSFEEYEECNLCNLEVDEMCPNCPHGSE